VAAGIGGDQQDAEYGGLSLRARHAQHAPDPVSVQLGDPPAEPWVGVCVRVVRDDARDQRLERGIPAERGGVGKVLRLKRLFQLR
jgi:hypothetical protein